MDPACAGCASPLAAAVLTMRRAWPLDPAELAVHRDEDGWFDALAVTGRRLSVLPDDEDAA
jgi:hypothetical protein